MSCTTPSEMEVVLGLTEKRKHVDLKKIVVISFDKGFCHIDSKKVPHLNGLEKEELRQALLSFIDELK